MAKAEAGRTTTGCGERDLTIRGTRIHVLEAGSGAPLVFLHGAGDLGAWTPALDALAGHFTVIRPDHPGFNASGDDDSIDSVHDLAFRYLDLLDALGLGRVILAGSSLGGWLAADLATIEPQRVSRLILIAPAGLRPDQPAPDMFGLSATEMADLLYHGAQARAAAREQAGKLATDTGLFTRYLRNRAATAHLGWNPYLHDPKLPQRLHRITAPVLILWGAHDRLLPPSGARRWAGLLPDATVELIDGAGHLPLAEAPGPSLAAVLAFCGKG
jgi:pimeloyl-ACP methyl ester carboxylesterase